MKHVGVNVAHDPLMTASYIGARGGLVLLSADDPSEWSSQNEQDNRYIAEQGYIPVLEPSSIQEAKDMMVDAFRLSEDFGHLFMVRSVTRISHGRSDVALGEILRDKRKASFEKDPSRLVLTPAGARRNRPLMIERFERIRQAVNTMPYNQLKLTDGARFGIIACGLSYSYALEAINWLELNDKVSVLKIGTPHPLPEELVKRLLGSVEEILVVEELEPFVETHVKAIAAEAGILVKILGKDRLSQIGELSTRKVTEAVAELTNSKLPIDFRALDKLNEEIAPLLPQRPPALCPGCPHRASFYTAKIASRRVARDYGKDIEPVYPGDIGCYTLAYIPPQEAVDTSVCMGGGFGIANGLAHILDVPVVAHLGDSTFFHSGIPPMINAVYNKANITMIVLDNSATAMTGFQPHPGTGLTAIGEEAPSLKIEDIARACGVEFVEVIDPFDLKKATETFEKAIRFEGPSVVVSRRVCTMIEQREKRHKGEIVVPYQVNQDRCNDRCDACITLLGCPAIIKEDGQTVIDGFLCTGCGICAQVCPHKAIIEE
jgi:indolepyruvate ferredoxin oxidoreductase alpha subunit